MRGRGAERAHRPPPRRGHGGPRRRGLGGCPRRHRLRRPPAAGAVAVGDGWLFRAGASRAAGGSTGRCASAAGRTACPRPGALFAGGISKRRVCRRRRSAASSGSSSRPAGPSSATGWPRLPARCSCCGTRRPSCRDGGLRACWSTCRSSPSSATTACGPSGCWRRGPPVEQGRRRGAGAAAQRAGHERQQHPVGLAAVAVVDAVGVAQPLEVAAGREPHRQPAVDVDSWTTM